MQIAAILEKRKAGLVEKPIPVARGEHVVLKVNVAPMCNEYVAYDALDFRERNRADSLGHEAAGEVVAVDKTAKVKVGDRVVALCGYPCGRCPTCSEGAYGHCPSPIDPRAETGSEAGECGFAQYMLKQDWLLVPIPADLSYEHASMILCGLGPTFGALKKMQARALSTVLITGLGAVGLGGVINATTLGLRVIGVARNPYRTKLAKDLGAEVVVDGSDPRALEQILDLTGGRGVDYAIETSSALPYQRLALDATRRLGQVTFLAEAGDLPIHVDRDLVQKGLTIRGSLDLNLRDPAEVFQIIRTASAKIDRYITHRLPLANVADAWEHQRTGECGKILLFPWQ